MAFSGAVVKKVADQTAANYTAGVIVAWDEEVLDVGGWHDNVTNNSRVTVPSGVSRVQLCAQIGLGSYTPAPVILTIYKNGATTSPIVRLAHRGEYSNFKKQVISPILEVTAGDYFELHFQVTTDTSITIEEEESWFAVRAITNPQSTYAGALVKMAADLTAVNHTSPTTLAFGVEVYDLNGWHDNVTNNTRLTVPSGVAYAQFIGQISINGISGVDASLPTILKNGVALDPSARMFTNDGSTTLVSQVFTSPLAVTTGDYFELVSQVGSDTSINVESDETWFGVMWHETA